MPSLKYNDNIITESAVVSQFLADAFPSHLVKKSDEEGGAIQRARINFFSDTYVNKVNGLSFKTQTAAQGEEKEAAGQLLVEAIVKELEPLLADAGPFFGGAKKLTLAEVCIFLYIVSG